MHHFVISQSRLRLENIPPWNVTAELHLTSLTHPGHFPDAVKTKSMENCKMNFSITIVHNTCHCKIRGMLYRLITLTVVHIDPFIMNIHTYNL